MKTSTNTLLWLCTMITLATIAAHTASPSTTLPRTDASSASPRVINELALPQDVEFIRPGIVRWIGDRPADAGFAQHAPPAMPLPQAMGAERLSLSPPFPSTNNIRTIAIFQDVDPWGSTRNQAICSSNGIAVTILGTNDMGVADLSAYDKVVISSVQTSNFYAELSAHRSWFAQYAYLGGLLEMHLATMNSPNAVDGLWLPGGFLVARYLTNDVMITATNFPMLRAPHTITNAMLRNWSLSTHGYFSYRPWGSQPIVMIEGTNLPCAVDFP